MSAQSDDVGASVEAFRGSRRWKATLGCVDRKRDDADHSLDK